MNKNPVNFKINNQVSKMFKCSNRVFERKLLRMPKTACSRGKNVGKQCTTG